jgi:peptide/nickel transport system substrate-binding protein
MRTLFSDISKNKGGNPHSMGPIGYSNDEITRLCEDQRFEVDFEARKEMFKQIQQLVSEEIPLFVLANQSSYSMFRKDYYDGWMKTYAYAQCEQNRLSFMSR